MTEKLRNGENSVVQKHDSMGIFQRSSRTEMKSGETVNLEDENMVGYGINQ